MHYTSHNLPDRQNEGGALTTVFCAVWHKQPDKEELLRSHWANLKAQNVPVEACYIFDNGDEAPEWLDATWHSFSEPLTIYEAWAAGVALARTPYVMNLNMDDRLATDAVRQMTAIAQATKSALVGCEWKVVFDRKHLTETFSSEDLWDSTFAPDWPPLPTPNLRLGSGTGERGSLGPATLWDINLLGKWYPTHFNNGEPIKSIGDMIFVQVLLLNKAKMTRVPLILGRYYSDVNTQAEFRTHRDDEYMESSGVSEESFATKIISGEISHYSG